MTTQISQVDAVVNAVTEVLGDSFVSGITVVNETLTDEQLKAVRQKVTESILNGAVRCSKDASDEKTFNRYVSGMVKNHFDRSKKLNGGRKHRSKSKGVPRDATLKELNKLLKTQTPGTPEYSVTLDGIGKRKTELSRLAGNINTSVAPPEVQNLINTTNV